MFKNKICLSVLINTKQNRENWCQKCDISGKKKCYDGGSKKVLFVIMSL